MRDREGCIAKLRRVFLQRTDGDPQFLPCVLGMMLVVFAADSGRAQDCRQVAAEAKIGRAKSAQALRDWKERAGDSYRARLLFAFRSFQLRPRSNEAAERLLALIPTDDAQRTTVMTLGDSLCDQESVADTGILADVRDVLPRELSRAVLLAPTYLPSYLTYSTVATLDPHSDHAVEMRRVCQKAHIDFLQALNKLPENVRRQIETHVLDPNDCKVITLPEAEF